MDDRGELIVQLARQMLDADAETEFYDRRGTPFRLFPTVMLVAFMAALGGGGIVWGIAQAARPLTAAERFDLNAMLAYTAHLRNEDEFVLRHQLTTRFELASLDALPARDLSAVRDWLSRQAE